MRLPIDTSRLKFLTVAPAEPLKQYEEGKPREAWAPRTDANGEVLWRAQLVALGDGERRRAFDRACKAIELGGARPYDLRHSSRRCCCTRAGR
jgi:hypothetical protein